MKKAKIIHILMIILIIQLVVSACSGKIADETASETSELESESILTNIKAPDVVDITIPEESVRYYVSSSTGNDDDDGLSSQTAWKTLGKVSSREYLPGEAILLKSGDTWTGESLVLNGNGTAENPIIVSAYGGEKLPVISPEIIDAACVFGSGVQGWKLTNLELRNAKDGILLEYDSVFDKDYIWIENMFIRDMDNTYNSNPFIFNHISSGIRIDGYSRVVQRTILRNLTVKNITFDNVNTGWWSGTPWQYCHPDNGFSTALAYTFMEDIVMDNVKLFRGGQWGYAFLFFRNALITNIESHYTGFISNPYGSAGIVIGHSKNIVFDGVNITNARRHPEQAYDGVGFDFEGGYDTNNITLKNAVIEHTDGSGIMVFDNGRGLDGITQNILVDNVVVSYFGENPGIPASKSGIIFHEYSGDGIIRNVIINRTDLNSVFIEGKHDDFKMENIQENTSISINKDITASSSHANNLMNPEMAVDGNDKTYWTTNGKEFPAWISVDLGSIHRITNVGQKFNIAVEQKFSIANWKYKIEVSTDNENWETVANRSSGISGNSFSHHMDITGRYVRLYIIDSDGPWASSRELAVFGVPIE